jgi:hypothetical protein
MTIMTTHLQIIFRVTIYHIVQHLHVKFSRFITIPKLCFAKVALGDACNGRQVELDGFLTIMVMEGLTKLYCFMLFLIMIIKIATYDPDEVISGLSSIRFEELVLVAMSTE